MILHTLNPVLVDLGPLSIRWYGLIYALGFVIAYFLVNYIVKEKNISLSKDDVSDLVLYMLIGIVLGARMLYVLVYNFPLFLQQPLSIVAVWQGGLSAHGGLLGAIVALFVFCKKKKIGFYTVSDIVCLPAILGLALGRIGNLFNGELFGRVTNVPWCLDYSQNPHLSHKPEGCRHPSQVYESLYSFAIFGILWMLNKKNLPAGTLTWTFVMLYGVFRTLAEFFRQPDSQLGFYFEVLSMGQLLSIPLIAIGGYMLWTTWNRR